MPTSWSPVENQSFDEVFEQIHRPLLKHQLASVLERSPFYRERLKTRAAIDWADLPFLPLTTKRDFLDDEAANPPFGSLLATNRDDIQRVHRTSGTSGRALLLALSRDDVERTLECGARCFWAAGVRPSDMVMHCLNYCMWAGGATDQQSLERTGAAVVPFGVGHSEELIHMVAVLKATAIHCTPSYLAKLENCIQKDLSASPRTLQLKLGLFGGEAGLQDSRFRAQIEATWGFRAVDANYGLADVLSMFGSECSVRDGLHFMGQGVVHPEVVSTSGSESLPWEPGAQGELVLTHLQKDCQPLVRYRTGDLIEVSSAEQCPCGRKSPRFRVVGRIDDMLVVRGINVFPGAIAKVVNDHLDMLSGEYSVFVSQCDPIERILLTVELRSGVDSNIPSEALIQRLLEDCRTTLSVRPEIRLLETGEFPKSTDKTKRVQRIL